MGKHQWKNFVNCKAPNKWFTRLSWSSSCQEVTSDIQIPPRNDLKSAFPQCLTSAGLGLCRSPVISSHLHLPGPTCSHSEQTCQLFLLHQAQFPSGGTDRMWGSLAIASELCSRTTRWDFLFGLSRLTVWNSHQTGCSARPCQPQPCWKTTGTSLALRSVCTDALAQRPLLRNELVPDAVQSSFLGFLSLGAFGPQGISGELTCGYLESFFFGQLNPRSGSFFSFNFLNLFVGV